MATKTEIDLLGIPPHMHEGVYLWVEHGVMTCSFLTAVMSNRLYEAFKTADQQNRAAMFSWCCLLERLPLACWGSTEKVEAWKNSGGLRGTSVDG